MVNKKYVDSYKNNMYLTLWQNALDKAFYAQPGIVGLLIYVYKDPSGPG